MNDGLMKRRLRSAPFSDWTANSAMEQHEVEEVSFLPGEAILNKKAVYEPSKSQRFRQIVCSRGVAISILMGMGATMVGIALIAAFARPASMSGACNNVSSSSNGISLAASGSSSSSSSSGKINNNNNDNNSGGTGNDGKNQISKPDYIATNGEKFPWKDLRLPTSIEPVNYDIFLHPNISQSYFKGRVLMTLKVLQKTDFIVFHTHELNLSDVAVKYYSGNSDDGDSSGSAGKSCRELQSHGEGVEDKRASGYTPGASVRVKKQLEYKAFQQYYVQTEVDLQPGTNIELTVGFRGSLADLAKMVGLYQSAYTVNGELRHMISTHFEASDARSAFPCMDEPELKATFSLKIVRDRAMITLFNTALLRQEPYRDDDDVSGSDNKGDSLVLDVYERTVCMSTYLVAYVVTDFKNLTKYTKDGVMVRVWAPEDKIYMGQFALDAAVTIIEKYNKFFGIAYPLKKQDLIAIPNFAAGAMENWGLITYRDTAVLYDPDKSTVYTKKIVALVVAHELAHQWFGNLVTMKWWNDLWLNEGFAAYVENIGAQTVDPSFRMFESMVSESKASLSLDSLSSSHAIEVEVKDPAEVQSAFNSITYKKGARLIHMLKGAIGGEKFHQGLNYYLRVHAYGNAETEQLWEAFEKYSNLDNLRVSEFMDTWTKQMGFPVVTVTRVNSLIEISQERFLRNNDSDTSPYSWHIPFKYKLSTNPSKTKMVWMKKGDASIHLPPSSTVAWIKGNADSEGYYRVNYDSRGWKAIGQQLMEDHEVFSVLDRVGLLDDAFKLAQSGRLKYSVVLDLCRYMVKEKDYFVWDTFIGNVMYLEERLYLHEAYDSLKTYILHLSKPLIDSIGWQETGPITERLLRTLMFSLAISSQYETVVNKSNGWFREWLADDSFKMNNDLRNMVFQCGVKYGTKANWDVVYDRFQASVVPSNKGGLMSALARSRDARTLQILLERSLDTSQIKSQSTASVVAGVAANPNGLLFAWRFVRQNWSTFFGRYGSGAFTLAGLINNVMGHFSTQFDLDEVSSFFQDKDLGSAKNSYHQTLDIIKGNIAWNKLHLEPVYVWLKDFVKANNLSNGST